MTKHFETSLVGNVLIVRFTQAAKWIDVRTANEIDKALSAVVREDPGRSLVLNINAIEMMATIMIGNLVRLQKTVTGSGGTLKLCEAKESVLKTLAIMGLDKKLEIVPNETEAVGKEALAAGPAARPPESPPDAAPAPPGATPGEAVDPGPAQPARPGPSDDRETLIVSTAEMDAAGTVAPPAELPRPEVITPMRDRPEEAPAPQRVEDGDRERESAPAPAEAPGSPSSLSPTAPHPRSPIQLTEAPGRTAIATIAEKKLLAPQAVDDAAQFLRKMVETGDYDHVVVDLQAVRFVSSAFLGELARLAEKLAASSGRLVLCGVSAGLLSLLQLLGLEQSLPTCGDVDEAAKLIGDS